MKSNNPHCIKVIATDLDGTLLPYGGEFHPNNIEMLNYLGRKGIVRIIATGRSLWSARKVLPNTFPIDYLVFSSGAGIYDWQSQQLILDYSLPYEVMEPTMSLFKNHDLAFTLHRKSPDNHRFLYYEGKNPHPNLFDYLEHYHPNGEELGDATPQHEYSQLLAFMPDKQQYDTIRQQITNLKTVRATSPIDDNTIWLECFHPKVSKANGIQKICERLQISEDNVAVIGNDYNDMDMLTTFQYSGVVSNAPEELKQQFETVSSVERAGFAEFVNKIMR